MRFIGRFKLLLVAAALGLAGCQTAGPAAKSGAARPAATQSSLVRPPVAARTDVVMGVGY